MNQLINNLVIASSIHSSTSDFSIKAFSDLLTSLAYFSIPLAILVFVRKKKPIKFIWMYFCFILFILLCGITHFLHVLPHFLNITNLSTIENITAVLTTIVSIITAILVWTIIPKVLQIPSSEELEEANKEIVYLAHYDVLTGLTNRNYFTILMEQAINEARKNNKHLAVVFIDLDRFKIINDTYGHGMGDRLLKEVAKRIQSIVGEKDIVSRQGGDEFLLLLQDVSCEKTEKLVKKIQESLFSLFLLDRKEIHCTPSLGLSRFPEDAEDAEDLIKYADLAMYKAKEKGRNNYQFFTKEMNEEIVTKTLLEKYLRKALVKNELELYYQPQFDVKTNKIVATEALVRWHHPVKGLISPAEFIPLAEETGLIIPIGEWVLKEACKQTKMWRDQGHDLSVSVNLSSLQLMNKNIVEVIKAITFCCKLDPQYLSIEVTESMAITDLTDTLHKLKQLQEYGINIALDDFGTGYSSLSYLNILPINTVKIDKSFINNIKNKTHSEIVKSVSNIAHSIGLVVVVEGVEDEEQFNIIRSLGIELIQGYFISKPLPKEEFEAQFLN